MHALHYTIRKTRHSRESFQLTKLSIWFQPNTKTHLDDALMCTDLEIILINNESHRPPLHYNPVHLDLRTYTNRSVYSVSLLSQGGSRVSFYWGTSQVSFVKKKKKWIQFKMLITQRMFVHLRHNTLNSEWKQTQCNFLYTKKYIQHSPTKTIENAINQ